MQARARRRRRSRVKAWAGPTTPSGLWITVRITPTPREDRRTSARCRRPGRGRGSTMPPAAMHPGDDAAADRGDAGEEAGREHGEAGEGAEGLEGDVGLLVGEQAAADAGDERADGEPDDLDPRHARCRRPPRTARWPGRRASPSRAGSCAAGRRRRRRARARPGRAGRTPAAGTPRPTPTPRSSPNSSGLATGAPSAPPLKSLLRNHTASTATAKRQRDDADEQPPDAERGQADDAHR